VRSERRRASASTPADLVDGAILARRPRRTVTAAEIAAALE
jgi:hypothetical protein